jgi:A/G-specific adenine glycosylase
MPELLRTIKVFYKKEGRGHLPWRQTRDPYKILVSEIMLQQTQVQRVVPFYIKFIEQFPTVEVLAQAPLIEVLRQWQGLGYNRRGKYLYGAAKMLVHDFGGVFPKDVEEIEKLPGVGPYTARAISTFAYNQSEVFIETNIRTVFMHFCFANRKQISDKQILLLVAEALKKSKMPPRDFYAALMDYGTQLKKQGIMLNSRSKHYTKQSTFEGSVRQLRGAIIRELLASSRTLSQLSSSIRRERLEIKRELTALQKENLITLKNGRYSVAS